MDIYRLYKPEKKHYKFKIDVSLLPKKVVLFERQLSK
jgi:hypothetical protein